MKLRQLVATLTVGTVALVGLQGVAGAVDPTFSVSDTTITVGETVTVHLTTPCLHPDGAPEYGNVIMSSTTNPDVSDNQETKGDHFTKGATGVFAFPAPGTYTITRFCDTTGQLDQVTITVSAPSTTTTSTTTTTTAPATTTTKAPASSTTSTPSGSVTTTTAATTTTVAASVAGISTTKASTSASSTATGAVRVAGKVSYTG